MLLWVIQDPISSPRLQSELKVSHWSNYPHSAERTEATDWGVTAAEAQHYSHSRSGDERHEATSQNSLSHQVKIRKEKSLLAVLPFLKGKKKKKKTTEHLYSKYGEKEMENHGDSLLSLGAKLVSDAL